MWPSCRDDRRDAFVDEVILSYETRQETFQNTKRASEAVRRRRGLGTLTS